MRVTIEHDNGKIETYDVTQEAEFTRIDDERDEDIEQQEREAEAPQGGPVADSECFLCGSGIFEDGLFCFGCRTYICSQHPQTPWGRHKPEDHDLP